MKIYLRRFLSLAGVFLRKFLFVMGIIFLFMCILAFTRVPFDIHRWLGTSGSDFEFTPDVIIMLGGSGMPSESNLIRLYYTSHKAAIYNHASVIVAHPIDSIVAQTMKAYLIESGTDSSRVQLMLNGTNTREQAMELLKAYQGIEMNKIAIVTSPENMYRTVKVFKKLGYSQIRGIPTFENAMFVDLDYNHKKLGGKSYSPDVSRNLGLRYNFWNYLKLEITCLREFAAIAYYKMNGWI